MRRLAKESITPLRRRSPYVLWGNEPMNGGNYLFLWATAWARTRREGTTWQVRYKPKMDPWLEEFPALRALTVYEEDVSRWQRRTVQWGQDVGVDFFMAEIKEFCREVLLDGSTFPERWRAVDQNATVVNVRRGDYYSNPRHRAKYGFAVDDFIAVALDRLGDEVNRIVVVSDDPQWCREHLDLPFESGRASLMPGPHDMFQDLAQLSAARQLILANSTFSYWGGYLASSRPVGSRPQRVVAPLFWAREVYAGNESPLLLGEWLGIPEDEFTPARR